VGGIHSFDVKTSGALKGVETNEVFKITRIQLVTLCTYSNWRTCFPITEDGIDLEPSHCLRRVCTQRNFNPDVLEYAWRCPVASQTASAVL
jgi:hypothetical protein